MPDDLGPAHPGTGPGHRVGRTTEWHDDAAGPVVRPGTGPGHRIGRTTEWHDDAAGPVVRPGTGPGRRIGRTTEWHDDAAGPVVRPYALTGGRTRAGGPGRTGEPLDLIAIVETADETPAAGAEAGRETAAARRPPRSPEHHTILELCRSPLSVAEVAAELDLALGVVRVLLGDLLDQDLIRVRRPAPVARFPNERVLKEVIDGLHAL